MISRFKDQRRPGALWARPAEARMLPDDGPATVERGEARQCAGAERRHAPQVVVVVEPCE